MALMKTPCKISTALAVSLLAVFLFYAHAFAGVVIKGAGPHFPLRLYTAWADVYSRDSVVKIDYRATGSREGVRIIEAGEDDFGASNTPLSMKELKAEGLYQFPVAIKGLVPVVNIKGIEPKIGIDRRRLRLTPEVLANIYLGTITRWDDERIAALNPAIELPEEEIIVVTRSNLSSTTWLFTKYLSRVSKQWRNKVGSGLTVKWPVGIGKESSSKVAAFVKQTPGAIGFVEYTNAIRHNLAYAKLRNRDGVFVEPWISNLVASAAAADWRNNPGYSEDITNGKGKDTWPIAGATYILLPLKPSSCKNAASVLDFFDWTFKNGKEVAEDNSYATLTEPVYDIIEKDWTKFECGGKPLWQRR